MTRQILFLLLVIATTFGQEIMMPLPQTWNLNTIFSKSEIDPFFETLTSDLNKLEVIGNDIEAAITLSSDIRERLREIEAYAVCLSAEDARNADAPLYNNRALEMRARFQTVSLSIDAHLADLSDADFANLLSNPTLSPLTFYLTERRNHYREKLSAQEERLINILGVTGFGGYENLYETLIGECRFPFQGKKLSLGQINNKVADAERAIRQEAFESIEAVFKKRENVFAQTLNNLAGFRVQTYKLRGWDSVLKEAVDVYRTEEQTLNAMWDAIEEIKPLLIKCLKKKAQLMELEKLSFCDVSAPIHKMEKKISYDEASEMILKQFQKFLPSFATFSKRALEEGWVEAENRDNKRPGGFCVDFPVSKESRIFMTYDGTLFNVETLAHELGHAYHNEVLYTLPPLNREIRENVAETASTMAEMIVADAALQAAKDPKDRLTILDDKVSRAMIFLMNVRARFLFEKRFYEARKEGYVTPDRLNTLMLDAQKEAYGNALAEYAPHYWASKGHFFITEIPFYNFPYTFGYLFSLGIYVYGKNHPKTFEEKYISLLRDTATMTVEDLAQKHLDVDLRTPTFWRSALREVARDCEEYLTCVE